MTTSMQQLLPNECHTLLQVAGGSLGKKAGLFYGNSDGEHSVALFLNWVFAYAAQHKFSDIHFSDSETGCCVRLRGQNMKLKNCWQLKHQTAKVVNTLIRAKSNITAMDKESPQDGSFWLDYNGQEIDGKRYDGLVIDVRVNILPTKFGQNIACRILDQSNSGRSLDTVYMPDDVRKTVMQVLAKEQGMVIVSGPTGSGKTSTLYSFLNHLNTPDKHIMTAEDPVEYRLPGADQVNINAHYRSFGKTVRAFLRQDPDIILVGEIRDSETANTAITVANTGHLLLSTIHANDAAATVIRLLGLEVERVALADALSAFFAQRLLNQLCEHCKEPSRLPETAKNKTRFVADTYFVKGKGCEHCDGMGISGRIPVLEFVVNNEEVRQAILTGDLKILEEAMRKQPQYKTLIEAGLEMSKKGLVDMNDALALGVR